MKRRIAFLGFALALVAAVAALVPLAASAQNLLPFDPTQNFAAMGQQWFGTLQGMAINLYITLFTIELMIVGFQAALYKDNIAEFFQTFVWKFAMAFVMLAVIGNAGNIFPKIVQMFQKTALGTIYGGQGGTYQCGADMTSSSSALNGGGSGGFAQAASSGDCEMGNPFALEAQMFGWAQAYFLAADGSKIGDSIAGAAAGIEVFGTAVPGLAQAFLMGHENFQLFCMGLGMTLVTAAMSIFLTYMLLTFETQIVMSIGVLFLAFQGSRFTAQFSQGYMSYAINVGTKFFVFYFIVAIIQTQFYSAANAQTIMGTIAGLIAGAAIPFGAGSIVLVALTSPIPLMAVVSSVLIAAVPNFAGSILSGSSALSASAAMQQLTTAVAGAGAKAGGGAMGKGLKDRWDAKKGQREVASGGKGGTPLGKGGGATGVAGGTTDKNVIEVQQNQGRGQAAVGPAGAAGAGAGAGAGAHAGGPAGADGAAARQGDPLQNGQGAPVNPQGVDQPAGPVGAAAEQPGAALTPADGQPQGAGAHAGHEDAHAPHAHAGAGQGEAAAAYAGGGGAMESPLGAGLGAGAGAGAGQGAPPPMVGAGAGVPESGSSGSSASAGDYSAASYSSGAPSVGAGSGAPRTGAGQPPAQPPRPATPPPPATSRTQPTPIAASASPGGTVQGARPQAPTPQPAAPQPRPQVPGQGAAASSGGSGSHGGLTTGSPTTLKDATVSQIKEMSPSDIRTLASKSSWSELSQDQKDAIQKGPDDVRQAAIDGFGSRAAKEGAGTQIAADMIQGMRESDQSIIAGLGAAAPKGEGQFQGVQIRVSNSDKPGG